MPDNKTESQTEPFILFELAGATYGLRSQTVRQTEMIDHITTVPNAPPFIEGVVFSRGEVLPALNLRARFGFPRVSHNLRTRLIVVTCQNRSLGLIVDSCREFVALPLDTLRPAPEAVTGLSGRYLEGIALIGSRLVFILDLEQILNVRNSDGPPPESPSRNPIPSQAPTHSGHAAPTFPTQLQPHNTSPPTGSPPYENPEFAQES